MDLNLTVAAPTAKPPNLIDRQYFWLYGSAHASPPCLLWVDHTARIPQWVSSTLDDKERQLYVMRLVLVAVKSHTVRATSGLVTVLRSLSYDCWATSPGNHQPPQSFWQHMWGGWQVKVLHIYTRCTHVQSKPHARKTHSIGVVDDWRGWILRDVEAWMKGVKVCFCEVCRH